MVLVLTKSLLFTPSTVHQLCPIELIIHPKTADLRAVISKRKGNVGWFCSGWFDFQRLPGIVRFPSRQYCRSNDQPLKPDKYSVMLPRGHKNGQIYRFHWCDEMWFDRNRRECTCAVIRARARRASLAPFRRIDSSSSRILQKYLQFNENLCQNFICTIGLFCRWDRTAKIIAKHMELLDLWFISKSALPNDF